MTFSVKKLPGEPIIVGSYEKDFSIQRDLPDLLQEMGAAFDAVGGPFYHIGDLSNMSPPSFEDIMRGMAAVAWKEGSLLRHPDLVEIALVTPNPLLQKIGQAFEHRVYGGIPTKVFATLDEALEYIRTRIASIA
ncbi:MAG TPA: hypothetical protein ENI95_00470 [Chloroflexi bacterium]|nr:hypothetical protein [Chloroflexota bacterium]